ncbi:MAG TPA: hypothetical protein VF088_16995 [Pyrinomonadaceae bacterium]
MADIYETLLPVLPTDAKPIVRTAIESFAALPEMDQWQPKHVSFMEALPLIQLGVSLSFVATVDTLDPVRRKLGRAIGRGEDPAPSDVAEIDAAALCIALGATSLEKVKEKTDKTPDFIVSWSDGKTVDLEVTSARAKPTHIERQQIAKRIAEQLHNQNRARTWDLIVHYINPSPEELSRLMKEAYELKPGLSSEKTGEWHVSAKVSDREPYTLLTAGQRDELPKWWPTDTVAPFIFYGTVAGPNATVAPPQVRITYGVPVNAYVNPVQNKAENPQGGVVNAFLIAIDVSELPGAFSTFKRELPKFFDLWKSVSGVMTFRSLIHRAKAGWLWQLIPNPHASAALPSDLLKMNAENVLETGVLLTSNQ